MRRVLVGLALACAAFAAAWTTSLAQAQDSGKALYNLRCSSCHGLAMEGSAQAPPLLHTDAALVDFMLETGRMPAMAPWQQEFQRRRRLTSAQIAAIVDYVMTRSQGDRALPAVHLPPPGWGLKKGREVFAENCQQCHAASARGNGAVGYREYAPPLMDATDQEVAEAVREGPGQMPKFGPGIIDAQSLNNLIAYVDFLKHGQYNPGGLQLANYGPVPEGFILWAFAITALVFLIRRIGSTQ